MDATVLRNAFLESISNQPDAVPTRRYFYCPSAHVKALREDSSLVQGIRGAGKSVWWALLGLGARHAKRNYSQAARELDG